jgi:hypothetical protein
VIASAGFRSAHDFEAAEDGTSEHHLDYEHDAVLRLAAGEDGRRNAA